jgi:hypothetical protein
MEPTELDEAGTQPRSGRVSRFEDEGRSTSGRFTLDRGFKHAQIRVPSTEPKSANEWTTTDTKGAKIDAPWSITRFTRNVRIMIFPILRSLNHLSSQETTPFPNLR